MSEKFLHYDWEKAVENTNIVKLNDWRQRSKLEATATARGLEPFDRLQLLAGAMALGYALLAVCLVSYLTWPEARCFVSSASNGDIPYLACYWQVAASAILAGSMVLAVAFYMLSTWLDRIFLQHPIGRQ